MPNYSEVRPVVPVAAAVKAATFDSSAAIREVNAETSGISVKKATGRSWTCRRYSRRCMWGGRYPYIGLIRSVRCDRWRSCLLSRGLKVSYRRVALDLFGVSAIRGKVDVGGLALGDALAVGEL